MSKNQLIRLAILMSLPILSGCLATRHAVFEGADYDSVFKAAVAGACEQKGLIVYRAEKESGLIVAQTKNLFSGQDITISVLRNASAPSVTATAPGIGNPWPNRIMDSIQGKVQKRSPSRSIEKKTTVDELELERQKLELEREKLKLEREKLELEKQKLNQQ